MERTWIRKTLLGLPVDLVGREEILRAVPAMVRSGRSHHLVALNPIKVMRAQKESDLRAGIQEAALVYPDAVGISWALRVLYEDRVPVLPGCELMADLFRLADRQRLRVFLVGALPEVLSRVCARLGREHPGLRLAGAHHGYFRDQERADLIARLLAAQPDLLFVALGARRQETFVRAVEAAGVVPVIMTVGGSFDAYAGAVPRAPRWLLRLRLEWLYRLVRQPFRAPRMLALPRFACRVLRLRYAPGSSPVGRVG
ncbi:MAG: WecB/TagA/CpsF family glycosyltransferase [Planctomycetota bacterium]|jgi:N-acetylglucosaminyldiphosphoundecaprenol N-acetyl-beta-D-mannosaminyltransferase